MQQTWFDQNKALWNNKVEHHLKSDFYGQAAFLAGKSSLTEIEADALGDVSGKRLLHMQCHFGQDTLSWARKGAKATGVDFSEKAIEVAKAANRQLGLDAKFVLSNVYDLPQALKGKFDIVFTSYGTIVWLPDLEKWASVVAHFLKKGGTFYIADFHPALFLFNFENYQIEYHYFNQPEPYEETTEGTYADPGASLKDKEYFWNHPLGEIIMSLTKAGLSLTEFKEYDFSPYKCFSNLTEKEPGRFVWGQDKFGVRLPHVYSLKMKKVL